MTTTLKRRFVTQFLSAAWFVSTATAQDWRQLVDAASSGWDATRLGHARQLSDSLGSTAVLVVHRGVVVAAWGDISRPIAVTSVRKSLMATLYGAELSRGGLSLTATLSSLEINDTDSLTSAEGRATISDLLSARSGVYRPAAQEPETWAARRPAPGTHRPNEAWFYNSWGFNVLGTVYERWRRRTVYAGFDTAVARPLGMEDYRPELGIAFRTPTRSRHTAHAFRMSARDLARVGELYVRDGVWNGRAILARGWRDSVSALRTDFGKGSGYGWLWWVNPTRSEWYRARTTLDSLETFAAIGAGAQLVLVAPREELVIVHLSDRETGPELEEEVAFRVAEEIAAARPKTVTASAIGAVRPTPFRNRPPRMVPLATQAPTAEQMQSLVGRYDAGPLGIVRVIAWEEGLFIVHPRFADIELMRLTDDQFVATGGRQRAQFARDADGRVLSVTLDLPGRRLTATRLADQSP